MGKNIKAGSVYVILKAKYEELSGGIKKGMEQLARGVKSGLEKAKSATASAAASIKKQLSSAFTLGKTLRTAAITVTLAYLAKKAISTAASFEQTKVAYETMLGSADKADAVLKSLTQFSTVTPFEPDQVYKAGKSLLAFGVPAEKLIPTLRKIGDLAAGTGKDFNELASVFGKIKTKGKAQAEELNQLAEAGIPIIQELAAMYGVTAEEVYKMGSEGKISFEAIEEAFGRMTGEGGKFNGMMEKQSQTFNGIMSTLMGNISEAGRAIAEHWLPHLKSAAEKLNDYAKTLSEIKEAQKVISNKNVSGKLTTKKFTVTHSVLNLLTGGNADSIIGGLVGSKTGKKMIENRVTKEDQENERLRLIRKWKSEGKDTAALESGASQVTKKTLERDDWKAMTDIHKENKARENKEINDALDSEFAKLDMDIEKKAKEQTVIKEAIAAMKEKLAVQKMITEGKGKEAAISKAIADAENKAGRSLTTKEKGSLSKYAGDLYDSREQEKKNKKLKKAKTTIDTAGSFYAGTRSLSAGPAAERTAKATEDIAKNTKETNQILKKKNLVWS